MHLISLPKSDRFAFSHDDPIFMQLVEQVIVLAVTVILNLNHLMLILHFLVLSKEGVLVFIQLILLILDFFHLFSESLLL